MKFFFTELKDVDITSMRKQDKIIVGLDIGTKTIGVSVSDRRFKIASGVTTVLRNGTDRDYRFLCESLKKYNVGAILFGWPVQMNGLPGAQCEKISEFVENIPKYFEVPLIKWDERFSTRVVDDVLIQADLSRKKRKQVIDKSAAIYILQGALDYLNTIGKSVQ